MPHPTQTEERMFRDIQKWLGDKNRKQSNIAFTASPLRNIAYLIERELDKAREDFLKMINDEIIIQTLIMGYSDGISFDKAEEAIKLLEKLKSKLSSHSSPAKRDNSRNGNNHNATIPSQEGYHKCDTCGKTHGGATKKEAQPKIFLMKQPKEER